jgi:hypothetical protein
MKNVTITLSETAAAWARVEAAKAGKSLSRYLGEILESQRAQQVTQAEALKKFLAAPDFPGVTEGRPSREELYAERLFRGHQRASLRERPHGAAEAKTGTRLAGRAHAKKSRGHKPAGSKRVRP